jgi:Tesmin/TSO1-like CXC domain, cysteine-rich domain
MAGTTPQSSPVASTQISKRSVTASFAQDKTVTRSNLRALPRVTVARMPSLTPCLSMNPPPGDEKLSKLQEDNLDPSGKENKNAKSKPKQITKADVMQFSQPTVKPAAPSDTTRAPSIVPAANSGSTYVYPMPPPMVRYSSSAGFSDISLPMPNLTNSRSFGPNGVFAHHYHQPHPHYSPPPYLNYSQSYGHMHGMPIPYYRHPHHNSLLDTPKQPDPLHCLSSSTESNGDIHQRGGAKKQPKANLPKTIPPTAYHPTVSAKDLTIAASALLDLTPATTGSKRTAPKQQAEIRRQEEELDAALNPHKKDSNKRSKHFANIARIQKSKQYDQSSYQVNRNRARITLQAQQLLTDVPLTLIACKCKNTMCLKLYCTCFQTGCFCDELICKCKDCKNTEEESAPRKARTRAIYEILHRRANAFEPRLKKKTGEGCSCKKSRYVLINSIKALLSSNY